MSIRKTGEGSNPKNQAFIQTHSGRKSAFTLAEVFSPHPISQRKSAFTLAEVLITLAIVGVVAAITLPSFIARYQERQTAAALKRFYTSLSQAYMYAKSEYGTPDNWYQKTTSGDILASNKMVDILTKYMKVSKICHSSQGCFPDVTYSKIDGKNTRNWNRENVSKFRTSDGMSIFIYSYGRSVDMGDGILAEAYGALAVDINGFKKPNCQGKDIFTFTITKDGVLPHGTSIVKVGPTNFPSACNTKDCYNYCEGCTAWVIYNENMDYLHCDGLSWDGAKTCKEVK